MASSGAPEQVHFTGIVDDVENYLRAADLFILASSREGTPNSVLEGMATGLPCLVTPFIGMSAGIGKAGDQYQLVEREPEAIAAALTGLLQDVAMGEAFGERGQRYVVEHVDQQRSLDRYAATLAQSALDRRCAQYIKRSFSVTSCEPVSRRRVFFMAMRSGRYSSNTTINTLR